MTSLEVIGGSQGDVINLQPFQVMTSQSGFTAAYGLPTPSGSSHQIPILNFDIASGYLSILGNDSNNIVSQTIDDKGFYEIDIDGHHFSSNHDSTYFFSGLQGATSGNVRAINFDGGIGDDVLILGSQTFSQRLVVNADDQIKIAGQIFADSIFLKAQDIVNQGEIIGKDFVSEFSGSYSDLSSSKIITNNSGDGGSILLNGGSSSSLYVSGKYLSSGVIGGSINFRGKSVELRGSSLNASGENGGGTILVGGDYQGVNSVDSPNLTNAESTFVDKYSKIEASAKSNGNGGKVIIWADMDTDFRGDIKARGGSQSGDGGFVEVSGKQDLNFVGNVDVGATNGAIGSILLDSEDIIINPDDGNDETFDISDLQKIRGNIILSATNDIIFNTEGDLTYTRGTYDDPEAVAEGTVTLIAGGKFSFYYSLYTNGRDLNVSASSINYVPKVDEDGGVQAGYIQSGSIQLTSKGAIDSSAYVGTDYYQGIVDIFSSGNIRLEANSYIYAGRLIANYFSTSSDSGNVNVSANGNIVLQSINTSSQLRSGNVSLVSTSGFISTGAIYSNATDGNAGSVSLNAFGLVQVYGINASSTGGLGGNVKLTSQTDSIIVYDLNNNNNYSTNGYGDINTTSSNANAGNVILRAGKSITAGEINAYAVNGGGNAGRVNIEANQDVLTRLIYASSQSGNGNNISITSVNGAINTNGGLISATSLAGGNAGRVIINSAGNIKVGDISARSRDGEVASTGVWNGGAVNITSLGNIET